MSYYFVNRLKNFLQAKVTANNDKNRTYSVFYIPKVTGMHKVSSDSFLLHKTDLT